MTRRWSIPPGQLEQDFARAARLQAELLNKERAIGRRVQRLAKGLADLMGPGTHLYRRSVGLHAFDVDGSVCLAVAYLEEEGDKYRYRYAVLCGGEVAVKVLRTAPLDPGDSDEPGSGRRVALAAHEDYEAFVDRLPIFLADVTKRIDEQVKRAETADAELTKARRRLSVLAKRNRA